MKKILSWVLVLAMMLGTCTTSFAFEIKGVDEAKDYVESVIADAEAQIEIAKAEIDALIDVIENGTDEEKAAVAAEFIADAKAALEKAGVSEEAIADAEVQITAIVEDIIEVAESELTVEEKAALYIDLAAALLDLTAEQTAPVKDAIPEIKAEVEEIIEIVENEDDEAAKAKIDAYVEFLKGVLGITDEDIADATEMVNELIAEITAYVEEAKNVPVDEYVAEIKAIVDGYVAEITDAAALQIAKLGHKHYEANDESYYVAIGGDTVYGTGIGRNDMGYFDLVAANYEVDNATVSAKKLLPSAVVDFIAANEAEIANADLITYQMDASSIIYAALTDTPDWEKYISADMQAVIDEVLAQAKVILAKDWEAIGNDFAADAAAEIKEAVLNNLPEWLVIEESEIDDVIAFCMPCIQSALAYTEDAKNEAVASIPELDELVMDYAEKVAYAVISSVVETKLAIEEIQAINPDATLVVVGMYNPANGLEIVLEDGVIAAGELVDSVIDVTNVYYAVLAAANKDFAFVDVSDAETNGWSVPVDVTVLDTTALTSTILDAEDSMHANAAGHEYIAEQIIKALTCVYTKYEAVDAENHAIMCAICDHVKALEAHDGDPCSKCGYEQEVVPTPTPEPTPAPTRRPIRGGGGGSSATPTPTPAPVDVLAKFTDLDANAWYYGYVKTAVEKGLMLGISDTLFAPDMTLTRGMFVTILHRIEGAPAVDVEAGFVDVTDQYFAEAVKWAKINNIVLGISDTEFAPDVNVTREQMATIIARYATFKGIEVPAADDVAYADADVISGYAQEAVKVTNKLGLLIGTGDNYFTPLKNASRAEAAALFVRLLDVLAK